MPGRPLARISVRIAVRIVMRSSLAVALLGGMTAASLADTVLDRDPFAEVLGPRQSTFLARDLATGAQCVLNGSDLETRFAPWSTFKIPNALIALQTGAASGIEAWRDWDPALRPSAEYWPEAWRQGQTLHSAFQKSAVWYFRDLALEIGAPQYRSVLTAWDYGNAQVPDGSDGFWLGGSLAVSVAEQVTFLERLLTSELGVSQEDLVALARMAAAGTLGERGLYGKTGAGPVRRGPFSGQFEGWYVGWLGQGQAASVVFAHHVRGADFAAIRSFRKTFAETLLRACGYR